MRASERTRDFVKSYRIIRVKLRDDERSMKLINFPREKIISARYAASFYSSVGSKSWACLGCNEYSSDQLRFRERRIRRSKEFRIALRSIWNNLGFRDAGDRPSLHLRTSHKFETFANFAPRIRCVKGIPTAVGISRFFHVLRSTEHSVTKFSVDDKETRSWSHVVCPQDPHADNWHTGINDIRSHASEHRRHIFSILACFCRCRWRYEDLTIGL